MFQGVTPPGNYNPQSCTATPWAKRPPNSVTEINTFFKENFAKSVDLLKKSCIIIYVKQKENKKREVVR